MRGKNEAQRECGAVIGAKSNGNNRTDGTPSVRKWQAVFDCVCRNPCPNAFSLILIVKVLATHGVYLPIATLLTRVEELRNFGEGSSFGQ